MRNHLILIISFFIVSGCNSDSENKVNQTKILKKKEIEKTNDKDIFKLNDENVMEFFLEYDKNNKENQTIIENEEFSSSSAIASSKTNELKNNDTITLKILNPTWLQIRDESNKIILSRLMEKNEEFSYYVDLGYNVTAGNAGNILVLIDQKVKGKIGKKGQVVDSLVINKDYKN